MTSHDGAYNCPGIVLPLTTVGLFGLESQRQRPWCDGLESNQQVLVGGFHSVVCGFTLSVHAAGLPSHMVRGVGFEPTKCSVTTRAPKSRHEDLRSSALAACIPSYIAYLSTFSVVVSRMIDAIHVFNIRSHRNHTTIEKPLHF